MAYQPRPQILERYADVLVNFALGGGAGIKPGETVYVRANEAAKPLYLHACEAVWRAGGNVIGDYKPDLDRKSPSRLLLEIGSDEQLGFFPAAYWRGLVDQCDHFLIVISEVDLQALAGIDPRRILRAQSALKPYMDWRRDKELAGRLTWTVALYGTPAAAAEAGLTERQYWNQIVKACFLDRDDPVASWRETAAQIGRTIDWLNGLEIKRVHVRGADVDLRIGIGERRQWLGGSGRNIPSFEVFTSPDWRQTEGWIRFNQPTYRYGSLIDGVELRFEAGRVVEASAKRNQDLLEQMIATEGADKVGEFSLTDRRLSRITKFMADTLFDENVGGRYGNTHIALGSAYKDAYAGDAARVSAAGWKRLGFNESAVHTDIVSTANRMVTAQLADGSERVIYRDGEFKLPGATKARSRSTRR